MIGIQILGQKVCLVFIEFIKTAAAISVSHKTLVPLTQSLKLYFTSIKPPNLQHLPQLIKHALTNHLSTRWVSILTQHKLTEVASAVTQKNILESLQLTHSPKAPPISAPLVGMLTLTIPQSDPAGPSQRNMFPRLVVNIELVSPWSTSLFQAIASSISPWNTLGLGEMQKVTKKDVEETNDRKGEKQRKCIGEETSLMYIKKGYFYTLVAHMKKTSNVAKYTYYVSIL